MALPVYPTALQLSALTAMLATFFDDGDDSAEIRLFGNDIAPDINSAVGSFTQPTFTTYAGIPLVMSLPFLNDQLVAIAASQTVLWRCTVAPVAPVTVYGIYVVDLAGNLFMAQRFDTPQIIQRVGDTIVGVYRVTNPLSGYGWASVE